jgi:TolA-binding protein
MHDVDEELREIKREIIESRGLVIKTNNLTNALSADVRSIAKRQNEYEKKLTLNSATAYVVFVVVVFVALKFAWDARIDAVKSETEHKTQENERLRKDVHELQKREEDRARAEVRAAQFYELVRQGKRAELVEGWEALKKEPLSKAEMAAISDAVERARNELAVHAQAQATDRARAGRWQEAASAYEEALKYKEDSAVAQSARLGLAVAYRKLGKQKDAIPILTSLADGPTDKEIQDDALYNLAFCHSELQNWNDAKNTWQTLIRKFPNSSMAPEGRLQYAQLMQYH